MTDAMRVPSNAVREGGRSRERRRHARFRPRECALELSRKSNTGIFGRFGRAREDLTRSVTDLSEGGARFVTATPLAKGDAVRVAVRVNVLQDTFEAAALVVWCYPDPQRRGHYHVGVRFADPDPVRARKIAGLRDYLNSPEVRQKEETRRRTQKVVDTSDLEYDG